MKLIYDTLSKNVRFISHRLGTYYVIGDIRLGEFFYPAHPFVTSFKFDLATST